MSNICYYVRYRKDEESDWEFALDDIGDRFAFVTYSAALTFADALVPGFCSCAQIVNAEGLPMREVR